MKALFVIIGVVVIFSILISSGGIAGALCMKGVGCVHTTATGGLTIDKQDPVQVQTR